MTYQYFVGLHTALEAAGLVKVAARRETKILRSLLGASKDRIAPGARPEAAEALIGKMYNKGYQPREYIGHLGGGGEGISDLVAYNGRLTARKTYNPDAMIHSPEGIQRKEEIMREAQKRFSREENPLTEFYGSKRHVNPVTGKGYETHYTEYVPHHATGRHIRPFGFDDLKNKLDRVHPDYKSDDFADTWQLSSHGDNIAVKDDWVQKVVDFLPAKKTDGVYSPDLRIPGILVEDGSTYFPNLVHGGPATQLESLSRDPAAMRAYMHRGALLDPDRAAKRALQGKKTEPATSAGHANTKKAPTRATAMQGAGRPPMKYTKPATDVNPYAATAGMPMRSSVATVAQPGR